nr:hypothetical protein [Tanacetum cinerariifolium]
SKFLVGYASKRLGIRMGQVGMDKSCWRALSSFGAFSGIATATVFQFELERETCLSDLHL